MKLKTLLYITLLISNSQVKAETICSKLFINSKLTQYNYSEFINLMNIKYNLNKKTDVLVRSQIFPIQSHDMVKRNKITGKNEILMNAFTYLTIPYAFKISNGQITNDLWFAVMQDVPQNRANEPFFDTEVKAPVQYKLKTVGDRLARDSRGNVLYNFFRFQKSAPVEATYWSILVFLNRLNEMLGNQRPIYDLSGYVFDSSTKAEDGTLKLKFGPSQLPRQIISDNEKNQFFRLPTENEMKGILAFAKIGNNHNILIQDPANGNFLDLQQFLILGNKEAVYTNSNPIIVGPNGASLNDSLYFDSNGLPILGNLFFSPFDANEPRKFRLVTNL